MPPAMLTGRTPSIDEVARIGNVSQERTNELVAMAKEFLSGSKARSRKKTRARTKRTQRATRSKS